MSGALAPMETGKRFHARKPHLHRRTLEAFAGGMSGRHAGNEAARTPFALAAPAGAAEVRCAETGGVR